MAKAEDKTRKTNAQTTKNSEPEAKPTQEPRRGMGLIDLDASDVESEAFVEAFESTRKQSG